MIRSVPVVLACAFGAIFAVQALAVPPDWVLALRTKSLGEYPPETSAVALLLESSTTVTAQAEVRTYTRSAYKILSEEGQALAFVRLPFDGETEVRALKAWNLKEEGFVHEVTQREAAVAQVFSFELFSDSKSLLLHIPQVEVGSIIAYEFEQKRRPYILQDFWNFQGPHPVISSRFTLQLPAGWGFKYRLINHADLQPREEGNKRWVWEFENIEPIAKEYGMPPLSSVAARLAVSYVPRDGLGIESWDDVARWFTGLSAGRHNPTPAIQDMSRQFANSQAAAEFVQKQIRYVAIEIGIGGYQPHHADQTLRARYGDCKDKVTLLRSFLAAQGSQVYPVLINTDGTSLTADFPSPYFNHVIAAIPFSDEQAPGPAAVDHPELGRLLLFDPTDEQTPFGYLPPSIQGTQALLISNNSGLVIETPIAPASLNRRFRSGQYRLLSDGSLEGELRIGYAGAMAMQQRLHLQTSGRERWIRESEIYLARSLPGVALEKFAVGNVAGGSPLTESYIFKAPYYAQGLGDFVLIRACVLCSDGKSALSGDRRKHPYQFTTLSVQREVHEITLPPGYSQAVLPEPVRYVSPIAAYNSSVVHLGDKIRYSRMLEIKQLTVPPENVPELRELFELVERDERSMVLLGK